MVQALRYNSGHVTAARRPVRCYNRMDSLHQGPPYPRLFSMFCSRQFVILLLLLGFMPTLLWSAPQNSQKAGTVRVKESVKRVVTPALPPASPAPPPTLEQLPAQPPQVSYLNGQLTIISRNSTLSDILHAVARQTGAAIELPPGAGFERVAGRMGPGPARNVLAELLNGSRYDYVMVASTTNPGGLQHVILTPKSGGADSSPAAPVATFQPPSQSEPQVMPNGGDMPPDASADDQDVPPDELPNQQPSAGEQPEPQAYNPGAPQPGQQPSGVKTPEQLLQELQRMQQQQQQQQQQQNPQR